MKVLYNGERATLYSCSNPDNLTNGGIYEVIKVKDYGFHTNFVIEGDDGQYGEYNSLWFEKIQEETVCIAVSNKIPIRGRKYNCKVLEAFDGEVRPYGIITSTVRETDYLGNHIYKVSTDNMIYYVIIG